MHFPPKLILAPAWHVWSDLRELMNSFYNDDLAQRVFILWIMAVLIVYGNNAVLVDVDIHAMRATVGAYLVARLSSNAMHLFYSFASYHHRPQQRLWFGLSGLALCIYVPLFFDSFSLRAKVAVAAVAVITEECVWVFCYSPAAKKLLGARYTTAVDIPHEVDRFAAFYIIVLGEYLYQIVVGSPAAVGFNLGLLRAVWTLIIAFCLNWLYIHNDGALDRTHPLRISTYAAFPWVILHLPLGAALLVAGHVAAKSAATEDLHDGELWLLCGGLGAGLICLYVLGVLHKSHDPPKTLMLPKVSFTDIFRANRSLDVLICLAFTPCSASNPRHNYNLPPSVQQSRHNNTLVYNNGASCALCGLGKRHVSGAPG
jgi:low temperature requirement protein LtrA